MANRVVWFDVPVTDLDRAIGFYSKVLAVQVNKDIPGMPMGVIQHEGDEVAGCLYQADDNQPSSSGPLLYFNVDGRLDEAVAEVEGAGGKILKPKHEIGPYGLRAIVQDSEGNRIALHSK